MAMSYLTGTLASSCAAQLDWQDGQKGKNDHLARKKVKAEPPRNGGDQTRGLTEGGVPQTIVVEQRNSTINKRNYPNDIWQILRLTGKWH